MSLRASEWRPARAGDWRRLPVVVAAVVVAVAGVEVDVELEIVVVVGRRAQKP
jgi:hypothetical protein